MQIRLKNIGIIKDSTLTLDGLTVITGKNNSGKTTVGKTLYAMLDAVSDLQEKGWIDRSSYVERQLNTVEMTLMEGFRLFNQEATPEFSKYPALCTMLFDDFDMRIPWKEMEEYAHKVEEELREIDSSLMDPYRRERRIRRFDEKAKVWRIDRVPGNFNIQRQQALEILEQTFTALNRDPELIDYARESINQTLRTEFSGQIQPVRAPNVVSLVDLSEAGENSPVYFHFSVKDNSLVNDGDPVFWSIPVKKAYMVDDPFILDAPVRRPLLRNSSREMEDSILDLSRIQPHNQKLRQALREPATVNIFEQTVLDEDLKTIKAQMDSVVSGSFEFSNESDYYIQNGAKIKLSNMATGSKMFSIIKILLEKGKLDRTAMLILDEPEAHLHPQWQNAFAEVIVLLVKELGVHVLLTTHSPNFMLALDAHMRKHSLTDRTNFYQTEAIKGGFVQYQCVNDDMGRIYDDFLRYLSEMKELRDRCLYGGEAER